MDIQGLDYNTHRDKLLMPEYGREIQKMVDYAIGLTEKSERQSCAQEIIRMMETKVPELRDNVDFEQTLWDHLYLMSHKQLDIDWPACVCATMGSCLSSYLKGSNRCLRVKSVTPWSITRPIK